MNVKIFKIPIILSSIVIVISISVMVGWFLNIDILKRIIPGFVTMKFSTALSFLFSGVIVLATFFKERRNNSWSDIFLTSSILVILILIGTSLVSSIFGFDSGLENLFISEKNFNPDLTVVPGRPSLGTMVAFICVSVLGITSLGWWNFKIRFKLYKVVGYLIGALGAVALIGYVINQPVLFYSVVGKSTAMAIHTALLFICISISYILLTRKT